MANKKPFHLGNEAPLKANPTKVAVCQVPDLQNDMESSIRWIKKFTKEAEQKQVSLICFPECFLQGYFTEELPARKYAVNVHSNLFDEILGQLAQYKPVIVFGLIEEDKGLLFNTAVVVKGGLLIGRYRKTHLLDGESLFTAGFEYPVFDVDNLRFGINICYDTQFPETTAKLTDQGVELILCVSNTMMSLKKAEKFKYLHLSMRTERVKENKIWMLSADITGKREGRIAYGSTSAINPSGQITEQIPFLETGMIIVEI
ncbi:MAG: putative hydrolase [Chitinophagaceae bacterium]|nr:putative hydrolase [Chitinophagaceae bacterium]